MLVAFDTTFLVPLLDPQVKGTGEVDARISYLIATLDRQRAKIVIPTPALSEVLIGAADAAPAYLESKALNVSIPMMMTLSAWARATASR